MLEQAIYLKQKCKLFFFLSSDTSQTGKVPGGNLPLNPSLFCGKCLEVSKMAISVLFTKSQNTNIHTFKDNMRSQLLLQIKIYITLSFRWYIRVLFTGEQMHLSLKIAIILCWSWPRSPCFAACCFRVLCTFQGSWGAAYRCLRCAFPVLLSLVPPFVGVCEMTGECCVVTPFKGRDCLHCLEK